MKRRTPELGDIVSELASEQFDTATVHSAERSEATL
jgi:hypothetical protein